MDRVLLERGSGSTTRLRTRTQSKRVKGKLSFVHLISTEDIRQWFDKDAVKVRAVFSSSCNEAQWRGAHTHTQFFRFGTAKSPLTLADATPQGVMSPAGVRQFCTAFCATLEMPEPTEQIDEVLELVPEFKFHDFVQLVLLLTRPKRTRGQLELVRGVADRAASCVSADKSNELRCRTMRCWRRSKTPLARPARAREARIRRVPRTRTTRRRKPPNGMKWQLRRLTYCNRQSRGECGDCCSTALCVSECMCMYVRVLTVRLQHQQARVGQA